MFRFCLIVALLWGLAGIEFAAAADDQAALKHFESHVRPLLIDRCVKCHGPEKQRGGLRLDSRASMLTGGESGAAMIPGKGDESLLLQKLTSGEMPPKGEPRLTASQIADIRKWLDAGAPMAERADTQLASSHKRWQEHWAFRKPNRAAALQALPEDLRTGLSETPALEGVPPLMPDAPAIKPALQAWYRADDLKSSNEGVLTVWPDMSGHKRDLVPTQGVHPNGQGLAPTFIKSSTISGRPAVRFDERVGLGSPGDNPIPIVGDAAFTISIVLNLQPRSGGYPHDMVVSFGEFGFPANPGKPLAGALGIQRTPGSDHRLAVVGGWGHDALLPAGSFAPLYQRPCVITISKVPGPMASTSRVFLSGVPCESLADWGVPTGSTVVPDFQPRQAKDFSVMLGQAVAGAGGILGDVAEVLIYSAALDQDQRQGVEASLARKYGLLKFGGNAFRPAATKGNDATSKDAPVPVQEWPSAKNLIDAFVLTKLAKAQLTSAPQASRQTLIRRAYFDLLGLPPTPEQVEKFVSDPSPFAWDALITQLLASPQYGERWGRHWLDVARYADSGGYETDMYYRHAWRYRDYVVKSFNDDKPYDRFVQEQIAGDEIWPDNLELNGNYILADSKRRALEAHTGTGFYALGPQIHESSMDARKQDYERLTDWADATGAAFLGVTLGCARCHDHKFDPFTQRDYFALQAVFARSRETERPIINAMEIADFKQHYPRIIAVRAARETYRLFEQSLVGRQPTPEEEAKRRDLLQAIGRCVLELPERATSTPNTPFDGLLEIPTISVLGHERPELVPQTYLLNRGDLDRPKEAVLPALPTVLAEATDVSPALPNGLSSRKELALWITRPDHPLTARVMVNRVWQWHFGRGLVATASDFGNMGQPPSHPELLDWLTTEFVAQGWSVKQLHRLIMTSSTYQLASDFAPEANLATDLDNRMLWRFNRRRLEGEAVWDSLHAVAGTIHLQLGGPPIIPPLSNEELASLRDRYRWVVTPDPKQHTRRGLYIVNYRNYRFPLFEVFDAPSSAVSSPGRDVSTVAPQSLWLLNNRTAWKQAEHLAARVVRDTGDQPEALVTKLWRITLGRSPSEQELAEAVALFEKLAGSHSGKPLENIPSELAALPAPRAAAFVQLCLTMFNHNEFLFID